MKLVSWKFWAVFTVLAAAWIAAGAWFDTSTSVVDWVSKVGIVGQPVAVLVFVTAYTVMGILGPFKWWRSDFGNRIVLLPLAVTLSSMILVWALFFHHGLINTPLTAWAYIGGYVASDLVLLWGTYLWIRAFRQDSGNGSEPAPEDSPASPAARD